MSQGIRTGKFVTFMDTKCEIVKYQYHEGRRIALELEVAPLDNAPVTLEELEEIRGAGLAVPGERMTTATVNVPEWVPETEDEILIKTWSENEELLPILIEAKIVEDTGKRYRCNHCVAAICRYIAEK